MLGARHVEVQLTQQGSVDRLNQVSINVLHATRSPNSVVAASWVTDDAGRTLMFQGRPTSWPEMKASKPIRTPHFKGHFHIAVSTREVFVGTFYVAGGFLEAHVCIAEGNTAAAKEALTKFLALPQTDPRMKAAASDMLEKLGG